MGNKEFQNTRISINKNDIDESLSWLKKQNQQVLPESLIRLLTWLPELFTDYETKKSSISKLLSELARSFHQIPSSEQVKNIASQNEAESNLVTDTQKLNESLNKIRKLRKYLSRAENIVVKKIELLPKNKNGGNSEDIDKNFTKKNESAEAIFSSPEIIKADSLDLCVNSKEESILSEQKGILIQENTRQKNDFIFMRNDSTLHFKTYFDPKSGHKFTPDLSLIGPENYNVTWRGIINSITLVMGMTMPIARVEKLFGSEGFSRSNIIRYMGYCAESLNPIYTHFGYELAQSEVIEADDTTTRVHELSRYFKKLKEFEKNSSATNTAPTPPWQIQKENSLFQEINSNWQFVSPRQDGKGDKKQLHTTCLSGLTNQEDLESRVILYRSHLGSVGNLLSILLEDRKISQKNLMIVSDLSSQNLIKNIHVTNKINIDYAGCASHARRPFARFLAYDFDNCLEMLDYFTALAEIEHKIVKSPEMKMIYRQHECGSISFWHDIKNLCQKMNERWSPETELGKATRYIIENFDTLTKYTNDSRLPMTNNRSERLLRYEKLMESSSFGRDTLEGRIRYDILRSYFQTCLFAKVVPGLALLDVLLTKKEIIQQNPENFTPLAIKNKLEKDPERFKLLNKILTEPNLSSLAQYNIDLSKINI